MCIERTGTFKLLVEENVVLVGSKLAIDHPDAISFLKRAIADSDTLLNGASKFGTDNPCPSTPSRLSAFVADGGDLSKSLTPFSKEDSNSFVCSPHIITAERLKLANWLLSVNTDSDVKAELASQANGDGIKLFQVMQLPDALCRTLN